MLFCISQKGAPSNLCIGFRKLGAETFLISNIGKDEGGENIMKFFHGMLCGHF